jgi:hypothetical protein
MKNTKNRQSEKGNVLFLILIAVALFAALSYAVTQSTRSGGGSGDNETALINSAQITQYPASVRTAVVRMIIGGTDYANLEFNAPSAYSDLTGTAVGVFHPQGGGATYVQAPASLMATGSPGTWHFNGEFEVVDVGTSTAADSAGNEVMAFLPGITQTLCNRINQELGISGDVNTAADVSTEFETDMVNDGTPYSLPAGEEVLGDAGTPALQGQPFGCFQNNSAEYVYYHVLIEQ